MAHLQFDKAVTDMTRIDGPLQNAPMARWQRKAQETLLRVHPSDNGVSSPLKARPMTTRTPGKNCRTPSRAKTPSKNAMTPGNEGSSKETKTPKTTPGKHLTGKTPNKKLAVTPGKQQDRFIPNRLTTNQDMSHFALLNVRGEEEEEEGGASAEYQQQLSDAMRLGQAGSRKILSFKNKCSVNNQPNNLNVLYCTGKVSAASATSRHIPSKPENILDAPVVLNDYYLHTLDWSSTNIVAAALGTDVYLWNATDSTIQLLTSVEASDYIASVAWITDGSFLGVGLSDGGVQIWDVNQAKLLRTMTGHAGRVGCLDWNAYILSSGSRTGAIHHHDVRVGTHHVGTLANHSQEVCGLRWSPDGQFLASGANDNTVNVWDATLTMEASPLHTFTEHQAAIKAISWCPWQTQLLATGGGTSDRHIRFWNTNTGTCVKTVDTQSQVCSVLWSKEHREIVSGHGYAMNQLSLWKYPAMTKVTDLIGHSGRILNLCMSPDGQTVASIAADETIRLWKCFAADKKEKKVKTATKTTGSTSGLSMTCIR
ncbi:cell division cycle protein 20 homolog [Littorina saxatilis]|uniref:CDC20/Fizzy WD40 domain-containing protein n=1 Tax=Littorina saxatilis TaxID=31220 RepID=A0AAN9ANZ0_9CAEN